MSQYLAAAIASKALDKLFKTLTEQGEQIDDYTESR